MKPRVYSNLKKLWEKHGAHDFGRISQIFFGFCLIERQFQIKIFQLTGRPDIVAVRNNKKFAFEVKTQSGSDVAIKNEDLLGVKGYTEQAIIAVLSYPDLDCMWVLAKANDIRAGKWPIAFLKQHSISSLEDELNESFQKIIEKYFTTAYLGTTSLYDVFEEVCKLEKNK